VRQQPRQQPYRRDASVSLAYDPAIMGSGAHGNTNSRTVGQYLAARLKEVGVGKFFAVPGDFNMGLLVRN
jgi:hypothetical protein